MKATILYSFPLSKYLKFNNFDRFFAILPKRIRATYLRNSINDVQDRLDHARNSAQYYEKRLLKLKAKLLEDEN